MASARFWEKNEIAVEKKKKKKKMLLAAAEAVAVVANEHAIFITYTVIVTLASVCVWYGSRLSLDVMPTENMSSADAMKFPLIASCSLFGLYLLFKYFSK